MKQFKDVVNSIIMLVIIGAFVYIYFFYLKGNESFNKREAETENVQQGMQQNDPNAAVVAGQNMNTFNQQNQLNMQEGDQFFNQQNRQNPLTMREENPLNVRNQQNRFNEEGQFSRPVQFQNPYNVPQAAAIQNIAQQAVEAQDKILQEGHWIGFEVIPLAPAIAMANNIPAEISGVLVDEVTLVPAEVGLRAGDVITAINGITVKDLKSFKYATKQVALSKQATITIYRGGSYKELMVYSNEELGVAQMEGAPMILATSKSPHGYYGPCDRCHVISMTPVNTNQLAKDLGDSLVKVAPNIRRGTPPPHRDRGTCSKCHVIL